MHSPVRKGGIYIGTPILSRVLLACHKVYKRAAAPMMAYTLQLSSDNLYVNRFYFLLYAMTCDDFR